MNKPAQFALKHAASASFLPVYMFARTATESKPKKVTKGKRTNLLRNSNICLVLVKKKKAAKPQIVSPSPLETALCRARYAGTEVSAN